jgi:hypothetical protein
MKDGDVIKVIDIVDTITFLSAVDRTRLMQMLKESDIGKCNRKGEGASYDIKNPNKSHIAILTTLANCGACDEQHAIPTKYLRYKAGMRDTAAIGGRLSECIKKKWIVMTKAKVVVDELDGTVQFRYNEIEGDKKPCYYITPEGRNILSGAVVQ